MSGKHYRQLQPSTKRSEKRPPGLFFFRSELPAAIDLKSLRLYWYGNWSIGPRSGLKITGSDSQAPSSGFPVLRFFQNTITLNLEGALPEGIKKSEDFSPWLEYRLETPESQKIDEEESFFQDIREWANDLLPTMATGGWEALWELVDQGCQAFLNAHIWWANYTKTPGSSTLDGFNSPYFESVLDAYWHWKPSSLNNQDGSEDTSIVAYGLKTDEQAFADKHQWIAWFRIFLVDPNSTPNPDNKPIDDKLQFEFYFVGSTPRPASWSFKALERYLLEVSRLIARDSVNKAHNEKHDKTREQRAGVLEKVVHNVRREITATDRWFYIDSQGSELSDMLGYVLDNYPLSLSFLELLDNGEYGYLFDWQQRSQLKDSHTQYPIDFWQTLVPKEHIRHVISTGQACHWLIEGTFPFHTDFENIFCEGDKGDALILIPIHAEQLGTETASIPLIAQVVWPRGDVPLLPDIRAALHRVILSQTEALRNGLLIHQFNKELGRFEFVRSLSSFLGHNLPKTTVTPLLSLAHRVERGNKEQLPALAARIRSFAHLFDNQLKALDIFRLPGSRQIQTEAIDLEEVLQQINLVFQALVEERAYRQSDFEKIQQHVSLQIMINEIKHPLQGYPPAIFHTLFVPIDNALKALDPDHVAADASRGRLRVTVEAREQYTAVVIADRSGGMAVEALDKLRQLLTNVAENARKGLLGLAFDDPAYNRRGARLGLGLPLAVYFLTLLEDESGNRGGLEIESQADEGTTVTLLFPINPNQKQLNL